ncbi:hypothetical protein ACVWZL_009096 [Bradyrhizobium sp. GM2.4]
MQAAAIAIDGSKKATNSRDLSHVQDNRRACPVPTSSKLRLRAAS